MSFTLIVIVFLPVIALIIVAIVAAIVHLVRRNRDEPAD